MVERSPTAPSIVQNRPSTGCRQVNRFAGSRLHIATCNNTRRHCQERLAALGPIRTGPTSQPSPQPDPAGRVSPTPRRVSDQRANNSTFERCGQRSARRAKRAPFGPETSAHTNPRPVRPVVAPPALGPRQWKPPSRSAFTPHHTGTPLPSVPVLARGGERRSRGVREQPTAVP